MVELINEYGQVIVIGIVAIIMIAAFSYLATMV